MNKVGLIGWNISHSVSPAMHNAAFAALGMHDWQYDLQPVPPDIVRQSLKIIREEGGYVGINVTVPLKQAVMPFVRPDDLSKAVGAVNTITFNDLSATNTDVYGFLDDLKAHDVEVEGKQVVVLGAGGAARAAIYGLVASGAHVKVVNRTVDKAYTMLSNMNISASASTWSAVRDDTYLIVNCTPVGMYPKADESPWNPEIPYPKNAVLYDMIYRPERTRLMEFAEVNSGRAIGGLGMLVRQGALSFKIWTGIEPPYEVMYAAAHEALA